MKVSSVFPAWNEGVEVERTVKSAIESVGAGVDFDPIVIDDGSTDGCCSFHLPPARHIHHKHSHGLGVSRNEGAQYGLDHGADVVSFHDSHMRFPPEVIEACSRKALESNCIVTASSRGFTKEDFYGEREGQSSFQGWGCNLYYNQFDGIQSKWKVYGQKEEWARTPGMMGAGYFIPRSIIEKLSEHTGQLWEDTSGRWGFSEEALSIKAYLLGIPIFNSRDHIIRHYYRSLNPLDRGLTGNKDSKPDSAAIQKWRNIMRSTAVLFHPSVFGRRFVPQIVTHLDMQTFQELMEELQKTMPNYERPWTVEDEKRIFTHLCGKDAPIDKIHPNLAWMPNIEEKCASLPENAEVLAWRMGEAVMRVIDLCPKAHITVIETEGHRSRNWENVIRTANVAFHSYDMDDPRYTRPPLEIQKFDLALVGGEHQESCLKLAHKLSPIVLRNQSADRLMIEDGARHAEEERLKVPATVQTNPHSPVTVLLLNYRRPENIGIILSSLESQMLCPNIILWNNGDPLNFSRAGVTNMPVGDHPLVSLSVQSNRNHACWPRWLMATLATSEFVCSMDDDLAFRDTKVLSDCVDYYRRTNFDGIIGLFGWISVPGKSYKAAKHINGCNANLEHEVDLVKGRFMFFPRKLLSRVPMVPPIDDPAIPDEDDIYINVCIAQGKRRFHKMPGFLAKRYRELPQRHTARAARPGHYKVRDRAVRAMFAHYGEVL